MQGEYAWHAADATPLKGIFEALSMDRLYLHSEDRTIKTLLARIKGEPIKRGTKDSDPMYDQPVPEPNRSKLLDFYRSIVTEELCYGKGQRAAWQHVQNLHLAGP